MTVLPTLALLAFAQVVPPPPAPQPYTAPVIRPFEMVIMAPDGPTIEDGAEPPAASALARPSLDAPVAVDTYDGHYEVAPSDTERAYDLGVAEAERGMDRRMGPLDGHWRVLDASGALLFRLVLSDPGGEAPVEGAWRDTHGRMGVAASSLRSGGATVIVLDGQGELRLPADGDGGTLVRAGQIVPVRVSHQRPSP